MKKRSAAMFLFLVMAACAPAVDRATVPPTPAEQKANQAGPRGTYRVIGVGDIMVGTNFPSAAFLPQGVSPGTDPASIADPALIALLRGADVTFGNLEGTLHDGDGGHKVCGNPDLCFVFRSPTFYAGFLADAGFDLVSVANNHSGDFLDAGRASTMAALTQARIGFAGYDRAGARSTVKVLPDGTTVGLAAFAPNRGTMPLTNIGRARALVADLAGRADIVIVSFHGGAEGIGHLNVPRRVETYYGENRGDVHAFARQMIDAGADIIFGHGPHVPRAVDVYKNRFIAYSLGNFWTYKRINNRGITGLAPVPELTVDRTGRLLSAKIHSVKQRGHGIPWLDPNKEAVNLVRRLTAEDVPEAQITIAPDGTLTWPAVPPVAVRHSGSTDTVPPKV